MITCPRRLQPGDIIKLNKDIWVKCRLFSSAYFGPTYYGVNNSYTTIDQGEPCIKKGTICKIKGGGPSYYDLDVTSLNILIDDTQLNEIDINYRHITSLSILEQLARAAK